MEDYPQPRRNSSRAFIGFVILAAGVLMLLRRMGYPIYGWVFTWPALLIWLGVYIAIKKKFRSLTPLWFIIIGGYFLARHQGWITFSIGQYFWPLLIISIGLSLVMRPRNASWSFRTNIGGGDNIDSNSFFDSVAIFWGVRKTILSKNFAKGDIVNVFGGTEINFMQADITNAAVIDLVVIFGGVKLIVPADWDVRVNVVHVFAGTDDKRQFHSIPTSKKVLLVNGTAIFGGIDITSY